MQQLGGAAGGGGAAGFPSGDPAREKPDPPSTEDWTAGQGWRREGEAEEGRREGKRTTDREAQQTCGRPKLVAAAGGWGGAETGEGCQTFPPVLREFPHPTRSQSPAAPVASGF